MESTLPDIVRTTTPTMLSGRTPVLSSLRTAPRRLGWVGPRSGGVDGVCRTQAS